VVAAESFAGRPTFRECLRRAGFDLIGPSAADTELPQASAWTLQDLINQEAAKRQANIRGWSLNVYLMVVSTLAGSADTTGAMFDRKRRGAAAVFYETLKGFFGRNDGGFELDSNFLFTAVHEVAHCLNLPHAFEEARLRGLSPASATFMNYPQDYQGRVADPARDRFQGAATWGTDEVSRYQQFWGDFTYNFHSQELLELRHGARRDLVTGDAVSSYRGAFSGSRASMAVGGGSGSGLELTLRLRGPDRPGVEPVMKRRSQPEAEENGTGIFEFGEPIQVEAELRSYLQRPRPVHRRLSVVTGDLEIHYQTPDNQFLTYRPPCVLCYIPRPKVINGRNVEGERDSWHKDVCLNLGARSFQFLTPGLYRIRASYRYHDTLLVSNVLDLFVRYPTPQVENLVVPLLDEDVATYFAFRGVAGLSAARHRLRDSFLDEASGAPRSDAAHPLQSYFCAYEGMIQANASRGTDELSDDDRHWFGRALGLADITVLKDARRRARVNLATLPLSNIELGKVGRRIHEALANKRRQVGLARALAKKLQETLQARGVPERVRKLYLPA
jgi:hypothetical protein